MQALAIQQKEKKQSNDHLVQKSPTDQENTKEGTFNDAGVPIFLKRHLLVNSPPPPAIQRQDEEDTEEELLQSKPSLQRQVLEEEEEPIQTKLTVSAPDDEYEQEADTIADQVMRMPVEDAELEEPLEETPPIQKKPLNLPLIQRLCIECEEEFDKSGAPSIHKKNNNTIPSLSIPKSVKITINSPGRGSPLDESVRSNVEPVLGADLSGVRVHSGPSAQNASHLLNAKAFTHRNNIFLGKGQSASDVQLMAHETTHVIQQSAYRSTNVKRNTLEGESSKNENLYSDLANRKNTFEPDIIQRSCPAGEEEVSTEGEFQEEYFREVYGFLDFIRVFETCEASTFSSRARMLILCGSEPLPTNEEEGETYREWLTTTGQREDLTADDLGWDAIDLNPAAFPLLWADRVRDALELEIDPDEIIEDATDHQIQLEEAAQALPSNIWGHGLPLSYSEARVIRSFHLSPLHARVEEDNPVKDYARQAIQYSRMIWFSSFVLTWNRMVDEMAEAIEGCEYVPSVDDYYNFQENRSQTLYGLQNQLIELWDEEALVELERDAVGLADAAFIISFSAGLYSLLSILFGWSTASERFDEALLSADGLVVGASDVGRFVAAVTWAYEHGYLGEAGSEILNAILEHGIEILAMTLGIIIAQAIPGLNVAVNTVLFIYSGVDMAITIVNLATAINGVTSATTVLQLQKKSTDLSRALIGDGLMALVDILLFAVSLRGARSRTRQLMRENPGMSEETALRQALDESGDAASRSLRRASDFDIWESGLNAETRAIFRADPELRRLYMGMGPRVRRILTLCRSYCIPTRPRPQPESIRKIARVMDHLDLADNHRGLREYLYYNRNQLNRAVEGFDDINTLDDLQHIFDSSIERYAVRRGGSARRADDGTWRFTTQNGVEVAEYEFGTYGHLLNNRGTNSFFQAHHGAQDAWAIEAGLPGYSRQGAPALLLRDARSGSPHRVITDLQAGRRGGRSARNYDQERANTRADLEAAEVPPATINRYLEVQDEYFARLYRQAQANNHSATDLRRWFGDWTP